MTRRRRDDLRFVAVLTFCMLVMSVSLKSEDLHATAGEPAATVFYE